MVVFWTYFKVRALKNPDGWGVESRCPGFCSEQPEE